MLVRTARLVLAFGALVTQLGACAEPECPVGTFKLRNICRHEDAGISVDDAAVLGADAAQQDDDDDTATEMDSATQPGVGAVNTDAGGATAADASSAVSGDAGAPGQLDSGSGDAAVTAPVDASADAVVSCGAGYVLKNGACEDIDECFEGTHQCHMTSTCANTAGAYDCKCSLGYSGGTSAGFACAPRIAIGNGFACALQADGRVKCWGANSHGELGDGTVLSHSTPAFVKGLDHIVAIAANDATSVCALRDDSRVTCWGDNVSGQLGDGTTDSHSDPKLLPTLTSAIAISVRNTRACAVLRDGSLRCWGSVGSLGTGGVVTSLSPSPITGVPSMASVAVDWGGAGCAVTRTGTVWCWGSNATDMPAQVASISNVSFVSVGFGVRCVLRNNGEIGCWKPDPSTSFLPSFTQVVSISVGLELGYVVQRDGSVHAWPGLPPSQGLGPNVYVTESIDAVTVAGGGAGSPSACAVVRDGTVRCWGINSNGQLGDGTTTSTDQTASVWRVTTAIGLDLW